MVGPAHRATSAYYTRKIVRHGANPAGVDWASQASQELRFAILLRVCDFSAPFSLNDIGCGYGALYRYLALRHPGCLVDYLGSDLSATMIEHARHGAPGAAFCRASASPRVADIAVASGIFNVVPAGMTQGWEAGIAATLDDLWATTRHGFAVNFMAPGPPEPRLYRTRPDPWIEFCQNRFGAEIETISAYGLNEFTLLIRPRRPNPRDAPAPG